MKRYICALLVLVFCAAGCAVQEKSSMPLSAEDTIAFTDDLGRSILLERPDRVAVLTGSFADIWCLAGGKDRLVAAPNDTWTSFDLELDETVVNLGGIKDPDLERLIAAEPDLVLASSNTAAQVGLQSALEEAGLTAAYFNVTGFSDYLRLLDLCTQMTRRPDCYEQYGAALEKQIEQARLKADGSNPSVLYVRATGASCKVKNSRDSVLGEMLADLDCVNIADGENVLLESLSLEAILAADPDHIFLVLQGADPTAAQETLSKTLLSNPAWEGLTAVREGRCHIMDHQLYNLKPNARWGEAYEALAQILYPEN